MVSGFLGVPGAMVELQYRGGLSTKTDRPASFIRTMGGKRKAMVGPRARREWEVSFDLIGSRDTHGLLDIARSAGEVAWYPADASAGNLLSPQAASFEVTPESATDAGLVQLPDGTVASTVLHSGTGRVSVGGGEVVPLRPGTPITVGAWGLAGLRFWGTWRDAAGGFLEAWSSGNMPFTGWQWREYTIAPPPEASGVDIELLFGTQYARPTVSWGGSAMDRPGRGCPKAIVHGLSESLSVIAQDDAYGSVGFSITEVG